MAHYTEQYNTRHKTVTQENTIHYTKESHRTIQHTTQDRHTTQHTPQYSRTGEYNTLDKTVKLHKSILWRISNYEQC